MTRDAAQDEDPDRSLGARDLPAPAAIVRVLEEVGVEQVFGMPGGKTGMLFDALFDSTAIRALLTREESLACVMAEACGRITGVPGVVMGQTSWLVGNGGLGILEAHLGSSPMLVLGDLTDNAPFSHQAPYQAATGHHGTWDAAATLRGMAKQVMVAHGPVEAVQCTQLAVKHALAGEPGPVVVLFHSSALSGTVGPASRPRLRPTRAYLGVPASAPTADQVVRCAAAVADAELAVFIAGNGVRNAHAERELAHLAERLGAGVATTSAGKGVFDETHDLALGVMGNFGDPAANRALADADVVVAVGTKLGPSDTSFGNPDLLGAEHQHVIHIDIEPRNVSWTVPADDALLGDAAAVLRQLAQALDDSPASPATAIERREALLARKTASGSFSRPHGADVTLPIHPQRIIEALTRAIPPGAFVTCDAGENRLFMNRYFQSRGDGAFLQPSASGGMGYAIPAAMAAKVAHPARPVLAVCGDGGFGIAVNGLLTAVEQALPILVVIFNNQALGWVRHGQGDRAVASELQDFDHAAISRSMGCEARRVTDADGLDDTIRHAFKDLAAAGRPVVLDVATGRQETYLDIASPLNQWE